MGKRNATAVHLTDRTMGAIRPGDSVSGRINQMVDRYLFISQACGDAALAVMPSNCNFRKLITAYDSIKKGDAEETWETLEDLIEQLGGEDTSEAKYLTLLNLGQVIGLYEHLEREISRRATVPTQT